MRRIGQHGLGIAAVGHLVLAHFHRHWRHRGHRLDAGDIDFLQLLDEGQHGVQFALEMLDLVLGDRDAGETGDTADGCGVDGHFKSLGASAEPRIADGRLSSQWRRNPPDQAASCP